MTTKPERLLGGRFRINAHQGFPRIRRSGAFGEIGGVIDLAHDARVDGLDLRVRDAEVRPQHPHVAIDWIVLGRPFLDLASGHVRLIVVLRMAFAAIGNQLDQGHAVASAGVIDCGLRHVVGGQHVVAVGLKSQDAVPDRLVDEKLCRGLLMRRRRVGVAVVLNDDNEGAPLDRGEIDALVKRTGAGGAVADIHQTDAILTAHLE